MSLFKKETPEQQAAREAAEARDAASQAALERGGLPVRAQERLEQERGPDGRPKIWKVLRAHGRIAVDLPRRHRPLEPRAPLEEVQADFKDASTVPADPDAKQRHVVETLNFVDAGTSILLSAQVNADYHVETAFDVVLTFLRKSGRPKRLTFDRDLRWVGSASGRDFPSAFVRFRLGVGVEPNVCPPRRPDKNPFVERYHRAYGEECL